MTKTVRTILIVSASAIGTGVVSAVSYVQGKKDGLKLAAKQQAEAALNASPAPHSGNRRSSEQAQA